MIIFYSGSGSKGVAPEELLAKKKAGFMLTFSDFYKELKKTRSMKRFKQHKGRMKKHGNQKN